MAISRWKPRNEMMSLRDAMNRMFDDSFFWPQDWLAPMEGAQSIPLDIYEEGDNLVVKASLPGMKPEDLSIEVSNNILNITGETKEEQERKEKGYHLKERRYGQVRRSVSLPYDVKVDKANAEFENGILTLTLPKTEVTKAKKIEVKVKGK
jgi:HSP20 family protein